MNTLIRKRLITIDGEEWVFHCQIVNCAFHKEKFKVSCCKSLWWMFRNNIQLYFEMKHHLKNDPFSICLKTYNFIFIWYYWKCHWKLSRLFTFLGANHELLIRVGLQQGSLFLPHLCLLSIIIHGLVRYCWYVPHVFSHFGTSLAFMHKQWY